MNGGFSSRTFKIEKNHELWIRSSERIRILTQDSLKKFQGSSFHWKWEEIGENVVLLTYPVIAYSRVITYMILYVALFPKFRALLVETFSCEFGFWRPKSESFELGSVGQTAMATETSITTTSSTFTFETQRTEDV